METGKESVRLSFFGSVFLSGGSHCVGSVGSLNGLMDGLCDSLALGSLVMASLEIDELWSGGLREGHGIDSIKSKSQFFIFHHHLHYKNFHRLTWPNVYFHTFIFAGVSCTTMPDEIECYLL